MYYAILHYEFNNKVYEYTLFEVTKNLLNEAVKKVLYSSQHLGKCLMFYRTEKNINNFIYGVFRL